MKRLSFTDPMIVKILEGCKTMTRRPFNILTQRMGSPASLRTRFIVGDIVGATCAFLPNDSGERFPRADYRFQHPDWKEKWFSARFMMADLAPAIIKITGITEECLDEITKFDAICEGCGTIIGFHKIWCDIYGNWNPEQLVKVYAFEVVEKRVKL